MRRVFVCNTLYMACCIVSYLLLKRVSTLLRIWTRWRRTIGWLIFLLSVTFFVRHVLFMRYYGDMLRGGVFLGSWVNYEPESLTKPFTLLESRAFANRLLDIYYDLKPVFDCNETATATRRSLLALLHLASELDPRLNDTKAAAETVQNSFQDIGICSESYEGSTKGWVLSDCPKVNRLGDLITVILVSSPYTNLIFKDIHRAYPSMEVIVVVVGDSPLIAAKKLRVVTLTRAANRVETWNRALKMVLTPYVFVGRDLRSFPSPEYAADLERAVRVLRDLPRVSVVGGARRNSTRHWNMPCHQTEIKNYAMKIVHGYRYSSKECMYCDYIEGPFVARTSALVGVKGLDATFTDSQVGFLDLFVRLQDRVLTMACPDLLFEVTNERGLPETSATDLIPFARKWLLDKVHLPGHAKPIKFDCAVTEVNCQAAYRRTDMFLMPPCCRQKLNNILALVDKFCRMWNLSYVLDSGSVLGAVKMSGVIPWDIDGDIVYLKKDHGVFETEGVKFFAQHNLTLSWFRGSPSSSSTYFQILSERFFVEMWGLDSFDASNVSVTYPFSIVPFGGDGSWVVAPSNPGKYSRNRYGIDVLKHAHSWRHTGGNSSWEPYESGKFLTCLNFKHHACIDRYPPDGNIPFDVTL